MRYQSVGLRKISITLVFLVASSPYKVLDHICTCPINLPRHTDVTTRRTVSAHHVIT